MKILFSGGGTMGSVIPLLAVAEELKDKNPEIDYYWLGTKNGPEEKVVRDYNIEFKAIAAGKFRRYFSLANFLDIIKVLIGLAQSILILRKWKPEVVVAAGGFVAVPVIWAAWLLGIPSLIHQQDARVGLANKLCAWCAKKITVCFEESADYFNPAKTEVVGNPIRQAAKQQSKKIDLLNKFDLKESLPVVLIMGGGRGAASINQLTMSTLPELVKFCQVLHITGDKNQRLDRQDIDNYNQYDFLTESLSAFELADLIVSRAGMGSLTEIAYLKKPSIIIAIPHSHQEDNAAHFYQAGAIMVLDQADLDEEKFIKMIKDVLANKKKMKALGDKAHQVIKWGAEQRMAELILEISNK